MISAGFSCPCCGFFIFDEPAESYELCGLCGWEDDLVQLKHPQLAVGANGESLAAAQRASIMKYPVAMQSFDGHTRDPQWRPLTAEETQSRELHRPVGSPVLDASVYYWRKPG